MREIKVGKKKYQVIDNKISFSLANSIETENETITEIEIRIPKVKDLKNLDFKLIENKPIEGLSKALVAISNLSYDQVLEMYPQDLIAFGEIFGNFFQQSKDGKFI